LISTARVLEKSAGFNFIADGAAKWMTLQLW
jgi:hypothetical protein